MKIDVDCRYEGNLNDALDSLGGAKEILRLDYESNYQGHLDCDVLLNDGRIFSYKYYYGSCSGCDDWDNRELSNEEISAEMLKEATIFDICEYKVWRDLKGDK